MRGIPLGCLLLLGCLPQPTVPPLEATAAAVERALATGFFGAVERYDAGAVAAASLPDLEVLEDTTRFTLASFTASLAGYVGVGTISHQLDAFHTTLRGPIAWTSYRNRGTFQPTAGGRAIPFERLETAVLVYEGGRWRVSRLQSAAIARP